MDIPITERNKKLLALLADEARDMRDYVLTAEDVGVLTEAARELAKPEVTVHFPSEHYLNPAKLPLPPSDYESLLMRIESKQKHVDDLLDQMKLGATEIQGHYESVPRDQMRIRAAAAIQDLFLHQRYARLHQAAKHG